MVLSKLGQIDSAEATVALTSAMKGYKLEVSDVMGVVDKLTAVDMEAAVSAGDIATAMSYTATSARIAGVDMNRLIGYISTVAEVTQAGSEQVGTFYKTLFARMGNVKLGRLIDPETEEDLSAVETVLSGVGIKLRDSNQEFRDFGDVLDETAANWDNYGTVQQRAIAVAFSGTRQQDKFLALMEHYDEAMKYAGVATESTGTAIKKYGDSYLTSVAAKQAKFTATFEQFSNSVLNSKLVAGLIDIGSGLLGAVDGTDKLIGTFPRLIALFGGFAALINKTKLSGVIANFSQVGTALNSLKNVTLEDGAFGNVAKSMLGDSGIKELADATKNLEGNNLKLVLSTKAVSNETAIAALKMNGLSTAEAEAKLAEIGFISTRKTMDAVTIKTALAEAGLVDAQLEEATSALAAADAEGTLNAVKAESILADKGVIGNTKKAALENLALGKTATNTKGIFTGLGASIKSAGKDLLAFVKTPLGTLGLIVGAVVGIIAIVNKLTTTNEEAMAAYTEAKSALDENKSSVEGLNSELDTNKKRIEEIADLELPTLADKTELDSLKEKNELLKVQLVTLQAQQKTLEDIASQAGTEAYNSINSAGFGNGFDRSGKKLSQFEQFAMWSGGSNKDVISGSAALNAAIGSYKATENEMSTIANHSSKRYLKLQKELVEYSKTISEVSSSYGSVIETFKKGTPEYEEAALAIAKISYQMGDSTKKAEAFEGALDKFGEKDNLIELAKSGNLTAESFKTNAVASSKLRVFLHEMGLSAKECVKYIVALATGEHQAAEAASILETSMSGLRSVMDGNPERMEDLESIQTKIAEGYEFSYTEIEKIKKSYPDLIEYISKSSNGWKIQSGVIDTMSTGIGFTAEQIAELEKSHGKLSTTLDETTGLYYISADALDKLGTSALQLQIDYLKAQTSMTTSAINNGKNRIAEIKAEMGAISTYSAMMKALNGTNDGALTQMEFESRKNANPDYLSQYKDYSEYAASLVGGVSSELMKSMDDAEKKLEEYQKQIDALKNGTVSGTPSSNKSEDKWKEAFEKEKAALDHQRAMNLISETKYTDKLEDIYKYYFKNKSKYLTEYNQYEEEVYGLRQSALTDAKSNIQSIFDSTKEMITQEWNDQKEGYEQQKEALDELIESKKDALEKSADAQKEALEAQKDAFDDAIEAQIDALEKAGDAEKEALEERRDAYEDAMDARIDALEKAAEVEKKALENKKDLVEDSIKDEIEGIEDARDAQIEAWESEKKALEDYVNKRKKALDDMRSEEEYSTELGDKQKLINDLQMQLNQVQGDKSAAGLRKRLQLQDELNKAQKDIAGYVSDHDYEAQIAALDDAQEVGTDRIDAQIEALNKKVDDQIKVLEASKELQVKMLETQIDGIETRIDNQRDSLEAEKKAQSKIFASQLKEIESRVEAQKTALEAYKKQQDANLEAQIKQVDVTLESEIAKLDAQQKVEDGKIDAKIKEIDNKLGNQYTLINATYTRMNGMNKALYDDLIAWNNKYGTGIQNDITGQWKKAYDAVRAYNGELSALGAITSISTKINVKGYASGTSSLPYSGIVEHSEQGAELILNAARNGGNYAMLNKGSPIFTAEQTNNLKAFMAKPSEFIMKALGNNVSSKMTGTVKASVVTNNNPTAVTINNDFVINGTDPSGIADEIKKIMPKITDSAVDKINKTIFRNGGRLTANSMA